MRIRHDRELPFGAVIIATDFSTAGLAAARYGALLARRCDAELIVVHAFTLLQPAMEAEALAHTPSVQRDDLERLLADALEQLAPLPERSAAVLREGSPADVIREMTAERQEPTLVVLGTHGVGALERRVVGSVAEGILRTIESPVLTVGPHVAVPTELAFRRILYATDFSDAAAHAASLTFAWARAFGSEVDVVHVVPDGAAERGDPAEREKASRGALDQLVEEHGGASLTSHQSVELGDVRTRVIQHARERGVDLIAMGAHQHSSLSRHLRTGPAFHAILEAPCPVLTIAGMTAQEAR